MSNSMKNKLLQLFCIHDWVPGEILEEYHDYSGFKVAIRKCRCPKCGKIKNRKYW